MCLERIAAKTSGVLLTLILTTVPALARNRAAAAAPVIPRADAWVFFIQQSSWLTRYTFEIDIDFPEDQPWWDVQWRGSNTVSEGNTIPVIIWRLRGDYLCPYARSVVYAKPGEKATVQISSHDLRFGDAIGVEYRQAYRTVGYRVNQSGVRALWFSVPMLEQPMPPARADGLPPWGGQPPYIDQTCTMEGKGLQ